MRLLFNGGRLAAMASGLVAQRSEISFYPGDFLSDIIEFPLLGFRLRARIRKSATRRSRSFSSSSRSLQAISRLARNSLASARLGAICALIRTRAAQPAPLACPLLFHCLCLIEELISCCELARQVGESREVEFGLALQYFSCNCLLRSFFELNGKPLNFLFLGRAFAKSDFCSSLEFVNSVSDHPQKRS